MCARSCCRQGDELVSSLLDSTPPPTHPLPPVTVVLVDHDWIPSQWVHQPAEQAYLAQWAANMSQALSPLMSASNTRSGVFSPACFIHTGFNPGAPVIGGVDYYQAFHNWYFNLTGPAGYKLADTCGVMCNPTC